MLASIKTKFNKRKFMLIACVIFFIKLFELIVDTWDMFSSWNRLTVKFILTCIWWLSYRVMNKYNNQTRLWMACYMH